MNAAGDAHCALALLRQNPGEAITDNLIFVRVPLQSAKQDGSVFKFRQADTPNMGGTAAQNDHIPVVSGGHGGYRDWMAENL